MGNRQRLRRHREIGRLTGGWGGRIIEVGSQGAHPEEVNHEPIK